MRDGDFNVMQKERSQHRGCVSMRNPEADVSPERRNGVREASRQRGSERRFNTSLWRSRPDEQAQRHKFAKMLQMNFLCTHTLLSRYLMGSAFCPFQLIVFTIACTKP